jgi:penicillin amidase
MATKTFRDPWGIPHLYADSADELAWLQGRTTALDRAWQLDWNHQRAEGRTAEAVGAPGLAFDRFARQAKIAGTAQDSFGRLDGRTRAWCSAFVDGVNSGLEEGAAGAHEFVALNIRPHDWQPWTPLAVFLVQQLLFGGFPYKLWRRHVADRLGPEAADLLAAEPADAPGSNAWAVSGKLTAGSAPMIAGDPHRTAEIPGVYQQVRLACDEFDVVGFTFPGVPGVQHFAHTGTVAWAITNAMADYQDLFIEQLRRDGDRVSARGPGGWEPVQQAAETMTVRDGEPETIEVLETDRGPVIIDEPDGRVLSLRTPSRVDRDLGFGALLPLLHARDVGDVTEALRHWVEPVNSAVIADHTGVVRHLVAGRVPVRNNANIDVPVPAWDGRYAWDGLYASMPVTDIDRIVVSANDRSSGKGLGKHYAPRWRANRIRARLDEASQTGPLNAEAMRSIHRDTYLAPGEAAQDLLRGAQVDGPAATVQDTILAWDCRMAADSQAAVLFAAWRSRLVDWLRQQPALAGLHRPDPLPAVYETWMNVPVRLGLAFEAICRNAGALGVDLTAGAAAALDAVAADPPTGTWGDRHRLMPMHGLSGLRDDMVPALPSPSLSGDRDCVLATSSTPGVTDLCSMAPMARYVWDLADRSASRWVVPFGASGRRSDSHFADQNEAWATGELIPVITDWSQLIEES